MRGENAREGRSARMWVPQRLLHCTGKLEAVPPSLATVTSRGSSTLVWRGLHVAGRDMLMLPTVSTILPLARPSLAHQVDASLGKNPALDLSVPRIVPPWPGLEAGHAGPYSQA